MPIGVAFRSLMAAGAGGAAAAWDVIDSTTLGSAAASISFATGLSGYKLFRVTAYMIKDGTGGNAQLRLNNDSGANYDDQRVQGFVTSTPSGRATSQTYVLLAQLDASTAGTIEIIIGKQLAGATGMILSESTQLVSGYFVTRYVAGRWVNTADLISRIDLISSGGNFAAGTVVVLEGVPD